MGIALKVYTYQTNIVPVSLGFDVSQTKTCASTIAQLTIEGAHKAALAELETLS